MAMQMQEEVEPAVRYSRRSLWFALTVLLLLGSGAVLIDMEGDSALGARLFALLPVVIVVGAAALGRPAPKAEMRAVASDELRQFSLVHAWRNGFLGVLAIQPLLAWSGAAPATMACATAMTGVVIALASVLWYDR
jgi:hypothetical protein